MANEPKGRDQAAIETLLRELVELRELDLRRREADADATGAVDAEIDRRTKELMDRFRDLAGRDPE